MGHVISHMMSHMMSHVISQMNHMMSYMMTHVISHVMSHVMSHLMSHMMSHLMCHIMSHLMSHDGWLSTIWNPLATMHGIFPVYLFQNIHFCLQIFDRRNVTSAKEMFDALCEHLDYASNGGKFKTRTAGRSIKSLTTSCHLFVAISIPNFSVWVPYPAGTTSYNWWITSG